MCLDSQVERRDLVSQSFICVRSIYWVSLAVRQKAQYNKHEFWSKIWVRIQLCHLLYNSECVTLNKVYDLLVST